MSTLKLSLRDNGFWYATGTINGKKINHSSGLKKPEKKAAREWLLHHELELINKQSNNCMDTGKFGVLLDAYVQDQPQMSVKEFKQIAIVRKHLGNQPVKKVRSNLDEYIRTRHAKNQPNTIERDVNSRIGTIINYGYQRKLCGEFLASVKHVDDTRSVYLSKELRDQFIAQWEGEHKDFTIVLLFQGLRFSQAAKLTGSDIMGDVLKTYTQKGPRKIYRGEYLYMGARVKKILTRRAKKVGKGELLFPNINYDHYHYIHQTICDDLNITDYRVHDNRTTFATHLSQDAQATDREVAVALTHRTTRNVPRYAQNRDMKNLMLKLT